MKLSCCCKKLSCYKLIRIFVNFLLLIYTSSPGEALLVIDHLYGSIKTLRCCGKQGRWGEVVTSWIVKREIACQITRPYLRFIRKTFKFIAQTPTMHWQQLEYKSIYLTFEYVYTCICLFSVTINLDKYGITVSQHKLSPLFNSNSYVDTWYGDS